MTAAVVQVRTGNEKHAREDDHFRLMDFHPLEPVLLERGVCANHSNPEWWVNVGSHNRVGNQEAKRLCREVCPVLDECEQVTDHVERATSRFATRSPYLAERMTTCVRAGLGPNQRYERRKAERKKEGA